MIVATDDKHYKAIADEIRARVGYDLRFPPEHMPDGIGEVYRAGHYQGFQEGESSGREAGVEQGKQAEQDRFWEIFQNGGRNAPYSCAFYGSRWTDEIYNPKYPFVTDSCNQMFYGNTTLTDTKVPIDISKGGQTFYLFQGATAMKTIREIITGAKTGSAWANMFTNCTSLENIKITGPMYGNVNFQWCPLTADSMRSVVSALSDTATGYTVTFNKSAKEAAFTDEEWAALIATKPNWTFSLL